MTPKVSQYINKTILVSIPSLFHDGKCRPFKLVGVEMPGLWLQADELASRLLPEAAQNYVDAAPVIFVPLAQIAGVLIPTQQPTAAFAPPVAAESPKAPSAPSAAAKAPRVTKERPAQT